MHLPWHNVPGERVTNKHLGTRLVCHLQRVLLRAESHPLQAFGAGEDWLSEDCHQWLLVRKHLDNALAQGVMFKSFSRENDRQTLFFYLGVIALGLGKRSQGISYWASILGLDGAQPNAGAIALNRDFFVNIKVTQDRCFSDQLLDFAERIFMLR